MSLPAEIAEQPRVLASMLERGAEFERLGAWLRECRPFYVLIAARGTSAHAGLFARYLWATHNELNVAFAAPSLFTKYERPPRIAGALVVGISQSGQSPDVVAVVEEARRQGCPSLAIVNEPDSPLAHAADRVLELGAGPEREVAATKTYTAQLQAMAMLSVAMHDGSMRRQWGEELRTVPEALAAALALEPQVMAAAERYAAMERCVVVGRGYDYATTHEWSLKLKELAYVVAERYSAADFRHGPIAVVAAGFPVLAVASPGAVCGDLVDLLRRLRRELEAETLVVSGDSDALAEASVPLRLPPAVPEWLSPLVSIGPCQLFAYHLTRAKGLDPQAPRGLQKVTRTR